jgi:sugar phosphate isomerase/epimerase
MFDTLHALYRNEILADYARAMGKDLVHIHVSDKNLVHDYIESTPKYDLSDFFAQWSVAIP